MSFPNLMVLQDIAVRIFVCDHYMKRYVHEYDLLNLAVEDDSDAFFPVLRIFGSSPDGKKCCLHVHGVFPYFYVLSPCAHPSDDFLQAVKADLNRELETANPKKSGTESRSTAVRRYVREVSAVKLTPFYGYHQSASPFLKIVLYNPLLISKASQLCYLGKVRNAPMQPHEAHIPYSLQFFIDYNLYGMDFIRLSAAKFRRGSFEGTVKADDSSQLKPQSRCQIELDCKEADILNVTLSSSGELKNPGLKYIWKDEAQRRESAEIPTPFSYKAESQGERRGFSQSESERMYTELLDAKLAGVYHYPFMQSTPKVKRTESASDSPEPILNNSDLAAELLTEYLTEFPKEETLNSSFPEIKEMFDSQKKAKIIASEFEDVFGDVARREGEDIEAEVAAEINEHLEMSQCLCSLVGQSEVSTDAARDEGTDVRTFGSRWRPGRTADRKFKEKGFKIAVRSLKDLAPTDYKIIPLVVETLRTKTGEVFESSVAE